MLTEAEMKNRESLASAIDCIVRHHYDTWQGLPDSMPKELETACTLIDSVLTNLEGGS